MWGVGVFRGPGSSVTGFYTRSEQQHGRLPGQEKKKEEKHTMAEAGIRRDCKVLGIIN